MKARWTFTIASLVCSSLKVEKAGPGSVLYSSLLFLFIPLLPLEVVEQVMALALTTVFVMVALTEADGPSAMAVLLDDEVNFNAVCLSASKTSSFSHD